MKRHAWQRLRSGEVDVLCGSGAPFPQLGLEGALTLASLAPATCTPIPANQMNDPCTERAHEYMHSDRVAREKSSHAYLQRRPGRRRRLRKCPASPAGSHPAAAPSLRNHSKANHSNSDRAQERSSSLQCSGSAVFVRTAFPEALAARRGPRAALLEEFRRRG